MFLPMMIVSIDSVARCLVCPVVVCRNWSIRVSSVSRNREARATGRARRAALELHLFTLLTALYSSGDEHDVLRPTGAL
jgi:hypothetical protein